MTPRATEPTDARIDHAAAKLSAEHVLSIDSKAFRISLEGAAVENLARAYLDLASRLSRRPADAPEGVRQQCINIAFDKLLTSQAREAVEIADSILALVSPAATRRAALEEVAKWFDARVADPRNGDMFDGGNYIDVADYCRRLAQGEGGE